MKSIAAYRYGLDLPGNRPSNREVTEALNRWLNETSSHDQPRVEDPVLIRRGLWAAVDRGVPLQFHVGYGDKNGDLHRCNPLLLTDFLGASRGSGTDVMLLHCDPYHWEAEYLAHLFEHVYCDVGLALNYTGSRSAAVLAESLELTPFHKALYSSDAFGAAELFYLGALFFQRGLSEALGQWQRSDGWPADEARRVAQLIAAGNANRVYRLEES